MKYLNKNFSVLINVDISQEKWDSIFKKNKENDAYKYRHDRDFFEIKPEDVLLMDVET